MSYEYCQTKDEELCNASPGQLSSTGPLPSDNRYLTCLSDAHAEGFVLNEKSALLARFQPIVTVLCKGLLSKEGPTEGRLLYYPKAHCLYPPNYIQDSSMMATVSRPYAPAQSVQGQTGRFSLRDSACLQTR